MQKLKHNFINLLITMIIFIVMGTTSCQAMMLSVDTGAIVTSVNSGKTAVQVTTENLNTALLSLNAKIENNLIKIEFDDEEIYEIQYDLSNKPTFISETTLSQEMSMEEYLIGIAKMELPIYGYLAVGIVQGVDKEDLLAYSEDSMSNVDLEIGEIDFSTDEVDVAGTINAFKDKKTVSDSSKINSYVWTIEEKNVTTTSCTIVSTLTVNTDADFSQIKGYAENNNDDDNSNNDNNDNEEDDDDNDNNDNNNGNNDNDNGNNDNDDDDDDKDLYKYVGDNNEDSDDDNDDDNDNDKKSVDGDLPQTGINDTVLILLCISLIILVLSVIKLKKYKGLK